MRYAPSGTTVAVMVRAVPDGRIGLEVRDEGPGIPPADRGMCFDRFCRRGEVFPTGVGLGLAIARRVDRQHGGDFRLADAPGGKGLAAVVDLPASQDAPRQNC